MIFSEDGLAAYIVPRCDFNNTIGWVDIAGLPRLKKPSVQFESPLEYLWEKTTVSAEKLDSVVGDVVKSLKEKFE